MDARLELGELWPFLTEVEAGLARATASGWQAVHPFVTEVGADLVRRAHGAGLAVNVWTVNAPHDLAAFGRLLGVDVSGPPTTWSTPSPSPVGGSGLERRESARGLGRRPVGAYRTPGQWRLSVVELARDGPLS